MENHGYEEEKRKVYNKHKEKAMVMRRDEKRIQKGQCQRMKEK